MRVIYSILRPSDWPWGMAIWFALGDYGYGYAMAASHESGEYLGTAPVPLVQ